MRIKISFADEGLRTPINQAIIDDLLKAVDSASHNLKFRHGIILNVTAQHYYENSIIVSVESECEDADEFTIDNVGCRLKGIASYLLHKSRNRDLYAEHTVGKRLLWFTIIPNQSMMQHSEQFSNIIMTANDAYNVLIQNKDAVIKAELMTINNRIYEASKHSNSKITVFAPMDDVIDVLKAKGYSLTKMPSLILDSCYDYEISWRKKGE